MKQIEVCTWFNNTNDFARLKYCGDDLRWQYQSLPESPDILDKTTVDIIRDIDGEEEVVATINNVAAVGIVSEEVFMVVESRLESCPRCNWVKK